MKIIVDTNILYTFFWKNSITRKILLNSNIEFYAPEYALEEINMHEKDICKKTNINSQKFKELKQDLAIAVIFLPLEDYDKFLKQAIKTCPDSKDIDFIALAIKMNLPLWSNDVALKRQNSVKVLSTKDLLDNNEFMNIISEK